MTVSMMFLIWLIYTLELRVRCQFEPDFSKDFKNYTYFHFRHIFVVHEKRKKKTRPPNLDFFLCFIIGHSKS